MKGKIFNIQRFSTHDGPGIRTVVFFCGCPLRCIWCQNPESQPVTPVLMHRPELCCGCGRCEGVCPERAVKVTDGKSVIDRRRCLSCGRCARVCPREALVLSGYETDVDSVMAVIMKDRMYYIDSGGGVTLSGGEASMQIDFAEGLLKAVKAKHINTAIETCGYMPESSLERLLPVTDLFLYDIKTLNPAMHVEGVGCSNDIILRNAAHVVASGKNVKIRMPLIPGFNDDEESVLALKSYVEEELKLDAKSAELLKYNPLGEVKYLRMGKTGAMSAKPQSDEYFRHLCEILYK